MITPETAKVQLNKMKDAALDRMDHITTSEKIAGAAVIGIAVGVAATAIGTSMLHAPKPGDEKKSACKCAAKKD